MQSFWGNVKDTYNLDKALEEISPYVEDIVGTLGGLYERCFKEQADKEIYVLSLIRAIIRFNDTIGTALSKIDDDDTRDKVITFISTKVYLDGTLKLRSLNQTS
jgi:hypothetical protein